MNFTDFSKKTGRVINYYIDTVKVKKNKKKPIIMRTAISPDCLDTSLPKVSDKQLNISGDIFFQVIENSGGIPYQLVFCDGEGKDYFLNLGFGITEMFGIAQQEFTPELLKRITEETIPLSDNIPSDPVDLREKILEGRILKYRAEMLVRTSDGVKKWIRDSCVSVKDDKTGKSLGLVGIFTDITAQKQAAIHLEKALERATESDRLKTAFLNNLPHEIRTPLNAIVGFSTLLNEPGQLSDAKLEFQEIITHSSDHLLEIVDDVVEISKIEANAIRLNRKEVNINEMIQRLYERFKPAAEEKNITLKYDTIMDIKDVIITTDGYKLFQSLNNLLSNAIKFTFEGKVEYGYKIKEDKLEFHVTDTGIGIGEEHQPNIFKPFFQAESSNTKRYEGTGLGLSIARAYIELLGGEIWFTSKQSEGSAFSFTIPDTRHNNGMKGLVL